MSNFKPIKTINILPVEDNSAGLLPVQAVSNIEESHLHLRKSGIYTDAKTHDLVLLNLPQKEH